MLTKAHKRLNRLLLIYHNFVSHCFFAVLPQCNFVSQGVSFFSSFFFYHSVGQHFLRQLKPRTEWQVWWPTITTTLTWGSMERTAAFSSGDSSTLPWLAQKQKTEDTGPTAMTSNAVCFTTVALGNNLKARMRRHQPTRLLRQSKLNTPHPFLTLCFNLDSLRLSEGYSSSLGCKHSVLGPLFKFRLQTQCN